jgi:hypothetical protein
MRQVLSGFPGVFTFTVAFPADKILELTAVNDVETRLDTTLRSSQGNRQGGGRRLEVLTYQLTPYAED